MKLRRTIAATAAVLIMFSAIYSQSTTFTYQGDLKISGTAANGNFDFEFALFDAISGGSQIGTTISRNGVMVSNSIFSATLDFGSQFPGANRYLEIRVRSSEGGSFTVLLPRQPISSSPYAIKSLSADTAVNATSAATAANATNAATATNALQLGGVAANQFVLTGDARLSDARSPLAGSSNYIQNSTTPQSASNFNISGNGTAGGTLSGNAVNATTQYNIGGNRVLTNSGSENVFAGVGAGPANTTGAGNSFFGADAGKLNTTGGSNSFFGTRAGTSNTAAFYNSFFGYEAGRSNTGTGNSFFGYLAGRANLGGSANAFFGYLAGTANTTGMNNAFFGRFAGATNTAGEGNTTVGYRADVGVGNLFNATAIGYNALVTQSNSLVLGGVNGINDAEASTNVGIGTTAPAERLHVVGNGLFNGNLSVSGTLNANLPAGNANYIQNTIAPQATSNFNISGTGTASFFNAVVQYNLNNSRFLAQNGELTNTFVGFRAGLITAPTGEAGFANTFVGGEAGSSNNTGNYNSFFGMYSGYLATSTANSFFGASAGKATTSGGGNSFFGYHAGDSNITGSQNTIIGMVANVGSGALTNATAIGYRAFVATSNSLVLGSINGVNGTGPGTNVGIGTPAPTNALHISSNGGNVILGNPGCNPGFAAIGFGATLSNCNNYSILGDGTNTIISRPVGGVIEFRQGNTPQASIDANGLFSIVTYGTGGVTSLCKNGSSQISVCSSSLRYKTNIGPFGFGLDVIKKLRPITFDWKDGGMHDLGLGAEDVARVEPLLVTYDKNGQVEGVKYDRVGVVLVNAVKEQQGQIDAQNKEIGLLKGMIEKQQEQIDELRKAIRNINPAGARAQKP